MSRILQITAFSVLALGLTACGHGKHGYGHGGGHGKSCDKSGKCEHHGKKFEKKFSKMDTDSNGKLSKTEFMGKFAAMDTDKDGAVSKEEMTAHYKNRKHGGCTGKKEEKKTDK